MSEHPDPTNVVADADVLAADLLVGGASRDAVDLVRAHHWMTLITTERLVRDARAVIEAVSDESLADAWERRARADFSVVAPNANGHPALVAAHAGNAATVLSLDERLQSAAAGTTIRGSLATSVKSPQAFVSILDPVALAATLDIEGVDQPD